MTRASQGRFDQGTIKDTEVALPQAAHEHDVQGDGLRIREIAGSGRR
jgi:hypothetical protein